MNILVSVLLILSAVVGSTSAATTPTQNVACGYATTRVIVSVKNGQYVWDDSSVNPTLTLIAGYTYEFITLPVQSTDPVFIKTSYAQGGTTANNYAGVGMSNGASIITFTPNATSAGTTLYYVDANNAANHGTINILPASACPTAPAPTTIPTRYFKPTTAPGPTQRANFTTAPAYFSTSLGCYTDGANNGNPALEYKLYTLTAGFTRQRCADAAFAANFTYYGLENGQDCWVGNNFNQSVSTYLNASTTAPANYCSLPCSGGPNGTTCGGNNAIDINIIVGPPTLSFPTSTAGTFTAFSSYPYNTNFAVSQSQAQLPLPQADLLPVYAPFTGASMVWVFLNCPTAACTNAAQTVLLCIDAESCNTVGTAGYFTIPIVGNSAKIIYNKIRLQSSTGSIGDYSITTYRYNTTVPGPTAVPTYATSLSTSAPYKCIVDSPSARVLSNTLYTSSNNNSVANCQAAALAAGYRFFGVEAGSVCYGDNVMSSAVTTTGCTTPCTSGVGMCGGANVIAVYELSYAGGPATKPGCYVDSPSNRVLNYKLYSGPLNSPSYCQSLAQSGNFNYYGVESGTDCWADYTTPMTLTSSLACSYPCSGSSSNLCGGYGAIQVYSLISS